jgi:hypothetical protein
VNPSPDPYQVSYSEDVREALRALLRRADRLGVGEETRAALQEIDYRLRIYPQFGEPFQDLQLPGATRWHAIHRELYVEYAILEDQRIVLVPVPIRPAPGTLLDTPDEPTA